MISTRQTDYVVRAAEDENVSKDIIAQGTCGQKLNWELKENGELQIWGTGTMYNWYSNNSVPWHDYVQKITLVTIGEGVISKSVYLKPVCIYDSGMTAYGSKIKTGFAFFDEVFHQPSLAVKFDKILW